MHHKTKTDIFKKKNSKTLVNNDLISDTPNRDLLSRRHTHQLVHTRKTQTHADRNTHPHLHLQQHSPHKKTQKWALRGSRAECCRSSLTDCTLVNMVWIWQVVMRVPKSRCVHGAPLCRKDRVFFWRPLSPKPTTTATTPQDQEKLNTARGCESLVCPPEKGLPSRVGLCSGRVVAFLLCGLQIFFWEGEGRGWGFVDGFSADICTSKEPTCSTKKKKITRARTGGTAARQERATRRRLGQFAFADSSTPATRT